MQTTTPRYPRDLHGYGASAPDPTSHGLKRIEYRDFSAEDERAHLLEAIRLHSEVTGARPTGWYTGRCSVNTVDLVAEEGGFLYVAGSYADEERAAFTDLNDAYVGKNGFPFIIASRDHDKASILEAFKHRLDHDRETEFAEACRQVERIARLRLEAMLP